MSERRPFPPSPRRLALARQAGLTAASPLVVGALACAGLVIAAVFLARAASTQLGDWIAAACRAADDRGGAGASAVLSLRGAATATLELALPLLGVAAIAGAVVHVAQTRALWLPRRRIPGAPALEPARVRRTALDITAAAVIGAVAFGWLWTTAPRLAALFATDRVALGVGSALASLVVALALAWLALGVLDALVRRAELAHALAMTVTEKQEDDRLTAADPRWRAQRTTIARGGWGALAASVSGAAMARAVTRASVLLLGDDTAIAIAWDPHRQPLPLRTATGRGPRATQLLGLARRHHVPVHRDVALAAALIESEGPVPDTQWARLAEIIAAVQAANTARP